MFFYLLTQFHSKEKNKKGFVLLDALVALSLFTVVLLVASASLLNITSVYRKTKATRVAIDNLSFTMESMARNIRLGFDYHCGVSGDWTVPQDCSVGSGDTTLAYLSLTPSGTFAYRYNDIEKRIEGGTGCGPSGCSTWNVLTSPELSIESFQFRVKGTDPADLEQPVVFITIQGKAGSTKIKEQTDFHAQTTLTQWLLDG